MFVSEDTAFSVRPSRTAPFVSCAGVFRTRRGWSGIHDHLKHGGLLLSVKVWDPERPDAIAALLTEAEGRDVHIHAQSFATGLVPARSIAVGAPAKLRSGGGSRGFG